MERIAQRTLFLFDFGGDFTRELGAVWGDLVMMAVVTAGTSAFAIHCEKRRGVRRRCLELVSSVQKAGNRCCGQRAHSC
eukprot:3681151-Rhodomonas_salina.4